MWRGELALPNQGQPSEITVVRGNRQSGTIGEPLGDSLVVRVVDPFGDPVGGAEVTWTAEVGGSVSPATSVTSSDGQAGTQRVLGAEVGTYLTTAAILGIEDAPEPAVFITIGVAARLALTVAPPATAASRRAAEPPAGAPTPGRGWQRHRPRGRGGHRADLRRGRQLAGGTSVDQRRRRPGGLRRSRDPGLARHPEAHLHRRWVRLGDRQRVTRRRRAGVDRGGGGDEQAAAVATAVATPPAVLVRDEDGNPLAGIPVTFKVTGGDGWLTGANPVTGGDGVATVGGWTLGQKAGANTVAATLSGLDVSGSPVMFTATATPGAVDAGKSRVSAAPATHHGIGRIEPEHDHGDRARRVRQPYPRPRRHPVGQRDGEHADPAGDPTGSDGSTTGRAERDRAGRPRGLRHDRGDGRERRPRR